MKKVFGLLCCLNISVVYAQVDEQQTQLVKKSTINASVTLGYGGIENPVLDAGNITSPILPSFSYYGDSWYFDDFSIGYSLIEAPNYYIDILGRFNDDGFFFELDGVEQLFALGAVSSGPGRPTIPSATPINLTPIERDLSYMVGVSSAFNLYDDIWLSGALLQDATDVHNGHEFLLNAYSVFELFSGKAGVEIGAVYKNKELIAYYYTVAAGESKSRLPKYDLESNEQYHIKLTYEYSLNNHLSLDFKLKHTWLGDNLANSHMIKQNGYFSGFAGVTYHF